MCHYALTQEFPGHRTFHTKPANVPGKLELSVSPRGRICEQRQGAGPEHVGPPSGLMAKGLGFILHLIRVTGNDSYVI